MALDADALAKSFKQKRNQSRSKTPQRRNAEPPRNPPKPPDIQQSPPHSPEAEGAVLGAMLANPKVGIPLAHRLMPTPHYFFNPVNHAIYQAALDMWESGEGLDLITFTQYLRDRKLLEQVGGASYVTALFVENVHAGTSQIEWYAEILREKFVLREAIATGTHLVRASYGNPQDLAEMLASFSQRFERIRHAAGGPNGSERFGLEAMQQFDPRQDPNTLVGHRWLVRGAPALLAGGSGYGKSSLEMQLAIFWACGRNCFGLRPVRPLKSLLIQAENDLGDMAEQFQGVFKGIQAEGDLDLEQFKSKIEANVAIHRVIGKSGAAFLELLDSLILQDNPDLVWIDPLFAFSGCDLVNAERAGRFLREGLFPIAVARKVGLIVLHHVGKPQRRDKDDTPLAEIDYQYLGFGTSEIQNAFRAVNILVPCPGTNKYKLVLSKRGERAGAKNVDNEWTRTIYMEHSKEGIYWIPCGEPEKRGPAQAHDPGEILDAMSVVEGIKVADLQKRMDEEFGVSKATFYRCWKSLKKDSKVRVDSDGLWYRKGLTGLS